MIREFYKGENSILLKEKEKCVSKCVAVPYNDMNDQCVTIKSNLYLFIGGKFGGVVIYSF